MTNHLFVRSFILLLFLFTFFSVKATNHAVLSADGVTLSREQTDQFSSLWVHYQGRICPFQTLAIDFTTKLTGKKKYKDANAEQVMLGWMLFPEKWEQIPLFEVKHPDLQALFHGSKKICFADFFNSDQRYKLEPYWREMYRSDKQTAFTKEAVKLDEKVQLIMMLKEGNLLELFPVQTENGIVKWYASADSSLPEETDKMTALFIRNFFVLYDECIRQNQPEVATQLIQKLSAFQQKNAGGILPSHTRLQAELLNNRLSLFDWLFKINLTLGCLGIFFFVYYSIKNISIARVKPVFYMALVISFLCMTFGMSLRGYISGRLPMSNGYETMLFIAWCSLLVGVLTRKYTFLLAIFSFLLSGFALLVAHIGAMNPQITPLVPVLQSPLLSIHVSLIMIAYGFCGFMVLNSITSFILLLFSRKNPQLNASIVKMKEMSELFMYPATFFMGAGIFVGAIWANVSWGRYWGWDPKEVWALITFLLMSFTLHGKTLRWFQRPVFYHLFVIVIFTAVLMTYFGVNYVLGGKHSYAG